MQMLPVRRLFVSVLLLAVAGCASVPAQNDRAAAEVMRKANQRWQALIDGEIKAAYEMTAPSYRGLVSLQAFRRNFGSGPWLEAQALQAECELEKCNVRIRMTYASPMPKLNGGKMTTSILETWIKEDGQWWFLPRP